MFAWSQSSWIIGILLWLIKIWNFNFVLQFLPPSNTPWLYRVEIFCPSHRRYIPLAACGQMLTLFCDNLNPFQPGFQAPGPPCPKWVPGRDERRMLCIFAAIFGRILSSHSLLVWPIVTPTLHSLICQPKPKRSLYQGRWVRLWPPSLTSSIFPDWDMISSSITS